MLLGAYPSEFLRYFTDRFPQLVLYVYRVFAQFYNTEPEVCTLVSGVISCSYAVVLCRWRTPHGTECSSRRTHFGTHSTLSTRCLSCARVSLERALVSDGGVRRGQTPSILLSSVSHSAWSTGRGFRSLDAAQFKLITVRPVKEENSTTASTVD